MEYIKLSSTGQLLSRIGLGGLPFGGHYGPVEKIDVLRTVHAAIDLGMTYFDTSPTYGDGRGEELLGEAAHHGRGLLRHEDGLLDESGVQVELAAGLLGRLLEPPQQRAAAFGIGRLADDVEPLAGHIITELGTARCGHGTRRLGKYAPGQISLRRCRRGRQQQEGKSKTAAR